MRVARRPPLRHRHRLAAGRPVDRRCAVIARAGDQRDALWIRPASRRPGVVAQDPGDACGVRRDARPNARARPCQRGEGRSRSREPGAPDDGDRRRQRARGAHRPAGDDHTGRDRRPDRCQRRARSPPRATCSWRSRSAASCWRSCSATSSRSRSSIRSSAPRRAWRRSRAGISPVTSRCPIATSSVRLP